jgi:hypothetical protein
MKKQRNMCTTNRFDHLCGHTYRIITFPCRRSRMAFKKGRSPEDETFSSLPRSGPDYHHPTCVLDMEDSAEEVRLFPTLCAKCEQAGVISEWLGHAPGGRFEVIKAWKNTHRHEVCTKWTAGSVVVNPKCFDHESDDTESDATATSSYETALEDQKSSTTLTHSPPRLNPLPRPSGSKPDLSCLSQKIESLASRVRERLAELNK